MEEEHNIATIIFVVIFLGVLFGSLYFGYTVYEDYKKHKIYANSNEDMDSK